EAAGLLSLWELTKRGAIIKQKIEEGITKVTLECLEAERRLETDDLGGDLEKAYSAYEASFITRVFAHAISIVLEVTVSGAYPDLPEIRCEVSRTMGVFQGLPDPCLLQILSWPLCVMGCMVLPQDYDSFMKVVSAVDSSKNVVLSNVT